MGNAQVTAIMDMDTQPTARALKKTEGRFKSFAHNAGASIRKGLSRAAKGAIVAIGATITASLIASIKSGFDQQIVSENAEALMKSTLGSADKARDAIKMLGDEAKQNPIFSKSSMIAAGAQLSGFAKGSVKALNGLVESAQLLAASNPGATMEDAGIAIKNALSGDYVSLESRFDISPSAIARLKKAGLSGKALIDTLLKEKGITQDTLSDMANTTGGKIAVIKNQFMSASQDVVAGILPYLKKKGDAFTKWFAEHKEFIVAYFQILIKELVVGIEFITYVISSVFDVLSTIFAFAAGLFNQFTALFDQGQITAWLGASLTLVKSTIWSLLLSTFAYAVKILSQFGKWTSTAIYTAIPKLIKWGLEKLKSIAPKTFKWLGGNDAIAAMDKSISTIQKSVAQPFDMAQKATANMATASWDKTADAAKEFKKYDPISAGVQAVKNDRAAKAAIAERGHKEQFADDDIARNDKQKSVDVNIRVQGDQSVKGMMGASA